MVNIWWNEKRNKSLNKRSDYFNSESKFFNQIYYILNLDKKYNSNYRKQVLIENWIIQLEQFRIQDLITAGDL